MTVSVIHCVVAFIYSGGLLRISGQQHLLGAVTQIDCQSSHFSEVRIDFVGAFAAVDLVMMTSGEAAGSVANHG
jgi:hypothetical protein